MRRFRKLGFEGLEDRSLLSGFVSIQSIAAGEGSTVGSTTLMRFPVQYQGMPVAGGFSVGYQSADTTATGATPTVIPPDYDYTSVSGSLFFSGAPGQTLFIDVLVQQDELVELTEYFRVELTTISNPNIGLSGYAGGTIGNDDSSVVNMTLADTTPDASLLENDLPGVWVYKLLLTARVDVPVDVYYQIMPMGIEQTDTDAPCTEQHVLVSGPFGATLTTSITLDTLVEPDESFQWRLTRIEAQGRQVTMGSHAPVNTIENDDLLKIVVHDLKQAEQTTPAGADTDFVVHIQALNKVEGGATVVFRTQDYTAGDAGTDYTFKEESFTFTETGPQSFNMTVKVKRDDAREADEKFMIVATNPQANFPMGLKMGDGYGWGIVTIENDDEGTYATGGGKVAFYSSADPLGAAFKSLAEAEYAVSFDVADQAAMDAALLAWVAAHGRVNEIAVFGRGLNIGQRIGETRITGPSTQTWAPLSDDGLQIKFKGSFVGEIQSDGDSPTGAAYCDWVCDDAAPGAVVNASKTEVYVNQNQDGSYFLTGTWIDFDGFQKKAIVY